MSGEGQNAVVRPLELRDAAAWRELFAAYGRFYATEFSDDVLDRVWALLSDPDAGIVALVAELGDRVVGIAHARAYPDTFTGGLDWYLDDLYVEEAARGAGAATALIDGVAAVAREQGSTGVLRWITAADNERAQRLYDRIATRTGWVTYERALGGA